MRVNNGEFKFLNIREDEGSESGDGRIICFDSRVRALTFVPAAHRQCARDAGSLAADEGTCHEIRPTTCQEHFTTKHEST